MHSLAGRDHGELMRVPTADDVGIEVYVDGPADGVPIVLLHGVTVSAEEFGWLVPRLAEHHRVVRFDFRGHGDSDRVATGRYPGPGFVADAVAVLEEVGRPALLLGHSLGGVVALAIAQQRPELVRAALVIDPGLAVAEDLTDGRAIDVAGLGDVFRLIHGAMPHVQASGISVEDFARQLLEVPTPTGPTAGELYVEGTTTWWASSQLRLDVHVLDVLVDPTVPRERIPFDIDQPIPVPVLALLADPAAPDGIVGSRRRAQLEAAGSPDLEVVVVDGAGHNLQDEVAHRATFLAHLDRFVATHG